MVTSIFIKRSFEFLLLFFSLELKPTQLNQVIVFNKPQAAAEDNAGEEFSKKRNPFAKGKIAATTPTSDVTSSSDEPRFASQPPVEICPSQIFTHSQLSVTPLCSDVAVRRFKPEVFLYYWLTTSQN